MRRAPDAGAMACQLEPAAAEDDEMEFAAEASALLAAGRTSASEIEAVLGKVLLPQQDCPVGPARYELATQPQP